MKYVVLLVILFPFLASSQDASPYLPAVHPNGIKRSYVRTFIPHSVEADPNALPGRANKEVVVTTEYVDGLGKPLQTVIKQGSLNLQGVASDLVSAVNYDPSTGRLIRAYLPFRANSAGGNTSVNDGQFKFNPFEQQKDFYQNYLTGQNETFFYEKTDYEYSPLNRIKKEYAAGNSWVQSGKPESEITFANNVTDDVRKWRVDPPVAGWGSYVMEGNYLTGQLIKNISTDENGAQIIEFSDNEGKLMLRKTQLTAQADAGTGSGYLGWLNTYYVYDEQDNVRLVVQPKGVDLLIQYNWDINALSGAILSEHCFRYEYDSRNRMIRMKQPGAAEVWMVYDARDRQVLIQDGNLRNAHQWSYTMYDEFDRLSATGLWTDNSNYNNLSFHLSAASASTGYPNLTGQVYEELVRNFYDDYNWRGDYGNPLSDVFNTSFNTSFYPPSTTQWPYADEVTPLYRVKGMLTGSRTKVLGSTKYLYAVNFYDENSRLIQVQKLNLSDGVDITTTQYSFNDNVLISVAKHQKLQANPQTHTITSKLYYDDLWRLKEIKATINSTVRNPGGVDVPVSKPEQTIARIQYDELGKLKTKKLSPDFFNATTGANGLETLTYSYNIRDWLTGINRNYLQDGANNLNNYFGMELGYDKQTTASPNTSYNYPSFNGNISGVLWKSQGDGIRRQFDYDYDRASRFLKADFRQNDGGTTWSNTKMDFSVKMGDGANPALAYDFNGNIKSMTQKGWKVGGPANIDVLTYSYLNNDISNRLRAVSDGIATDNKIGDFTDRNTGSTDYDYDDNGNLLYDLNKRISSITYNQLDLPVTVTVLKDDGNLRGTITYTYDGAGQKLQKQVIEGNVKTITSYYDNYVYQSVGPVTGNAPDVLQFIMLEEGRARFFPVTASGQPKFEYDYFIKDHLNNTRMVLTEEDILDQYPLLSFEGAAGSPEAINQQFWENKNGSPIDVNAARNQWPTSFFSTYNPSQTPTHPNGLYAVEANKPKGGFAAGKLLKVFSGDRLHITTNYYYHSSTIDNSGPNGLSSMITGLLGTLLGGNGGNVIKDGASLVTSGLQADPLVQQFFYPQGPGGPATVQPKAYLNILVFDEQFRFDDARSKSYQVEINASGVLKSISFIGSNAFSVVKNGYVFAFLTNESNTSVYFDNFTLSQERGRILEETHYGPWGNTLTAISSQRIGTIPNRIKFNGKEKQEAEFSDGNGLEWYDFGKRMYDVQTGRWIAQDGAAGLMRQYSPYVYSFNNPTRFIDENGLLPYTGGDKEKQARDIQKGGKRVDMNNAPSGSSKNALGFKRNGPWFWKVMLKKFPDFFDAKNKALIRSGHSPKVNMKWIDFHPNHKAYKGDKLIHHHKNQGNNATGIPQQAHRDLSKELHTVTNGKASANTPVAGKKGNLVDKMATKAGRMGGRANMVVNIFNIFGGLNGNPDNFWSQFGSPEVGKLMKDQSTGWYVEPQEITHEKDKDGKIIRTTVRFKAYTEFEWDSKQGRYIGVGEGAEGIQVIEKGKGHKNFDMRNII